MDGKEFIIRQATEADADDVFALGNNNPAFRVSDEVSFYQRDDLTAWLKEPEENILLVARQASDDTFVGFLFCKVISKHWAMLDTFLVKPEFRGRGAGRQLIRRLTSQLRHAGIDYLSTLAAIEDKVLMRAMARLGLEYQKTYGWLDMTIYQEDEDEE